MTYWDTNTATVWTKTLDAFSQPTYGTPYTIKATWQGGGNIQTEQGGDEFAPMSTFYTLDGRPKRGDYIARGDQTATANPITAEAEMIRKRIDYDMSQFNEPTEYELFT